MLEIENSFTYFAKVVNNLDQDHPNQVLIQAIPNPGLKNTKESGQIWVPIMTDILGAIREDNDKNGYGFQSLPEIGSIVLVLAMENELSSSAQHFVLGTFWNKSITTPSLEEIKAEKDDFENKKIFDTYNDIVKGYKDRKTANELLIKSKFGTSILFDENTGSFSIGNPDSKTLFLIDKDGNITLACKGNLTIEANRFNINSKGDININSKKNGIITAGNKLDITSKKTGELFGSTINVKGNEVHLNKGNGDDPNKNKNKNDYLVKQNVEKFDIESKLDKIKNDLIENQDQNKQDNENGKVIYVSINHKDKNGNGVTTRLSFEKGSNGTNTVKEFISRSIIETDKIRYVPKDGFKIRDGGDLGDIQAEITVDAEYDEEYKVNYCSCKENGEKLIIYSTYIKKDTPYSDLIKNDNIKDVIDLLNCQKTKNVARNNSIYNLAFKNDSYLWAINNNDIFCEAIDNISNDPGFENPDSKLEESLDIYVKYYKIKSKLFTLYTLKDSKWALDDNNDISKLDNWDEFKISVPVGKSIINGEFTGAKSRDDFLKCLKYTSLRKNNSEIIKDFKEIKSKFDKDLKKAIKSENIGNNTTELNGLVRIFKYIATNKISDHNEFFKSPEDTKPIYTNVHADGEIFGEEGVNYIIKAEDIQENDEPRTCYLVYQKIEYPVVCFAVPDLKLSDGQTKDRKHMFYNRHLEDEDNIKYLKFENTFNKIAFKKQEQEQDNTCWKFLPVYDYLIYNENDSLTPWSFNTPIFTDNSETGDAGKEYTKIDVCTQVVKEGNLFKSSIPDENKIDQKSTFNETTKLFIDNYYEFNGLWQVANSTEYITGGYEKSNGDILEIVSGNGKEFTSNKVSKEILWSINDNNPAVSKVNIIVITPVYNVMGVKTKIFVKDINIGNLNNEVAKIDNINTGLPGNKELPTGGIDYEEPESPVEYKY